jgi:hypothetical protein
MAKPIEQIYQDLNNLKIASTDLGAELTVAYKSYFEALAPTLKQQSIQGCYYLCTNGYTEAFLKLSYNQRSQLLKTLQRVIGNAVANLLTQLDPSARNSNNDEDDDEPTGDLTVMSTTPTDWFATPESLSTWQKNLESEIRHTLKDISYKVNMLLQQAQVMPPSIPKPILEANPQADERGGNTSNIPNLLSVLIKQDLPQVEQSNSEDEEEDMPTIVQIHSLYLRLTEVEFSNAAVLTGRKNLSQLANKAKTLRREYLQKLQELKVAEAESAWRNSWFEE